MLYHLQPLAPPTDGPRQGAPETGEQLHCNALAAGLPAGRHDIAGPAERARTRRTVENSVFREPGKSCRPERDFGHGPKTPSGVPAILDLIALLMQGASRMIRDRWQAARRRWMPDRMKIPAGHAVFGDRCPGTITTGELPGQPPRGTAGTMCRPCDSPPDTGRVC